MSYRDVSPGSRGTIALVAVLISLWVFSSLASAQTLIIPSITATETYDSNVFYTPKSLLSPDAEPEDFITTVTPQINIAHTGSLLRGSLSVGALVSRYLHNSNLDYTGYNANTLLDFGRAAQKVSQRISSLAVRGTFQYTPSASGFAATQSGLGTGVGTGFGTNPVGLLNNGLVTNRASMHRYNLGVTGGYQLTPTTTLTGTYDYSRLTFGSQSGGVNNPLFGTTGHQGSLTIGTRITARDTVGASAYMSHYIQDQSGTSGQGTFTTIRETLNWSRLWTQRLTSTVSGGGVVTLPVGSAIPGQSVKTQFAPSGTVSLSYTTFSEALRAAGSAASSLAGPFDELPALAGSLSPGGIAAPGQYTTTLLYTYSIYPGYAFGAGPTKTHVLGVNVVGGITRKLSGQASMNYAHGSSDSPVTTTTYDSVRLTAGLSYLIGPVFANLTYTWMDFSNSTGGSSLAQTEYQFSKKMVMLSLSSAFSSDQFFRMGGFGDFGNAASSGPAESKPDESSDQMMTK